MHGAIAVNEPPPARVRAGVSGGGRERAAGIMGGMNDARKFATSRPAACDVPAVAGRAGDGIAAGDGRSMVMPHGVAHSRTRMGASRRPMQGPVGDRLDMRDRADAPDGAGVVQRSANSAAEGHRDHAATDVVHDHRGASRRPGTGVGTIRLPWTAHAGQRLIPPRIHPTAAPVQATA